MNSISLNDQAHIMCGRNTSTLFHQFELWTSLFSVMMLIRHKGAYFFYVILLDSYSNWKPTSYLFVPERMLKPSCFVSIDSARTLLLLIKWEDERNNNWWTMCISDVLFYQIQTDETELKARQERNFVVHSTSQQVTKQQHCRLAWRRKM